MKKAAAKRKAAAKKPTAKTRASRKPLRKPAPRDLPYDEDGTLLRRIEAEIFRAEDREEGDEDTGEEVSMRAISAALDPSGELSLQGVERDTSPRIHGDHDDEEWAFSITIPPHAVPRLAYELVRERFKDNWSAEKDLALFCLQHDIPFEKEES